MLLLPRNDQPEQRLGVFLIADEIVVDDKARVKADPAHFIEFFDDLLGPLGARTAAEGDDDIAELALKRTAAGELQRPGSITIDLEQVVARLGDVAHVRRIRLLIERPVGAPFGEALDKFRPGLIGLAGKQDIAEIIEIPLVHRSVSAANHGEQLHRAQLLEDLPHALLLHVHPGDSRQCRTGLSSDQTISSTFSSSKRTSWSGTSPAR